MFCIQNRKQKGRSFGSQALNRSDKEKGYYVKCDIESCDTFWSDNESIDSDSSDSSDNDGNDSDNCKKRKVILTVTVTIGGVTVVLIYLTKDSSYRESN